MNEKPKTDKLTNNDGIIKKKNLNSNNINKENINKESKRKQKRLFQMQKRQTLFNEEGLPENESKSKIKLNEELKGLNNINCAGNSQQISPKRKSNYDISKSSCNLDNNFLKDNLNIEQIQQKKSFENKKLKNNLEKTDKIIQENEKEQDSEQQNEISPKKKNTNSNTNDEDKASTEFPNELDKRKSKSIFQNDSIEGDVFTKIINGDLDENPNIFSGNNDNDEINDNNMEKEEIFFQDNFMNNFNFENLINEENNNNNNDNGSKKDENVENDNSVIINDNDQDNFENQNNEEDNKEINNEDSNVELNISNLEIDINDINEESNAQNEDDLTFQEQNSNEFAKKYLSSKNKSFIKFNNNLTARVAANNSKNSMSYMLALCPELIGGIDKKDLIKENYAATDVISEDIEAENFTPRQSEKMEEVNINSTIEEKNKNTNSININNDLENKIFRNKEIRSHFISNKETERKLPKAHYKNRSKIDKLNINNISNNNSNIYKNNYNTNYEKIKGNTILNDEHKIKYRHQKAKSLVNNNNNQIDSFNLNSNINMKNSQHSPRQISDIINKKNTINKLNYKNIDKKKKKLNLYKEKEKDKDKDKETDHFQYKQNYLSNENKKKNNQKNLMKSNSNVYSNTATINSKVKSHNYCRSDLRDKVMDIKKKFTFIKKSNANDLVKSNNCLHKKNNNLYNNKICYTEKSNKSKNYTSFISHIKKNTPDNINNISELNINHSKKLSQQISDGYQFFISSITNNKHSNNKYTDSKKNFKKKRIGSINFSIKTTPLSNYFSFNKNKTNNNSNYNNNVTFVKKNGVVKEEKPFNIIPNHNKSKTSFITPSYQNLNFTKNKVLKKNYTLIHNNNKSKKTSEISSKNIKKNYIKKINNKFNEIKKIVNDSSIKIVHKKINTIGQTKELTKLLNNNSNYPLNKQLKDSSSYSHYKKNFNKHKIIMALQHINFTPLANYTKVLNELYKSKNNLFIILVYTDSNKRYIFRGLYEVNSNDQKIANKLFAPGYGQNTLNVARLNNFFNYKSSNGEFIRIKFNNENEKKFNGDTIIAY